MREFGFSRKKSAISRLPKNSKQTAQQLLLTTKCTLPRERMVLSHKTLARS